MEKTLWITGLGETMRPDFLKEAVQYPYGKALFLVPNLYFRNLVRRHGVVKTSTIDALPREILRLNGRENERIRRPALHQKPSSILLERNYCLILGPLPIKRGSVTVSSSY